MKLKIGLICAALVVLAQLLMYAHIIKATVILVERESQTVAGEIHSLEAGTARLQQDFRRLELMLAAIPPEFLEGVEDPEAGFMEFLNYINDPVVDGAGVQVRMRRSPTFTHQPIPHHESQFGFSFHFTDTRDAENLLNYVLHQPRFPVRLSTLNLRGGNTDEVSADLLISLHIPARHTHPLAALHGEKR